MIDMDKTKKILISTVLVATLVVAGYFLNLYAYVQWRYEMTIVVETPEGIKTGSAIRQVSNFSIAKIFETSPYYNGESVVVDLGDRGILFAQRLGPAQRKPKTLTTVKEIKEANKAPFGAKTILKEEEYPRMVSFTDMTDGKSAVLVRGWQYKHDAGKHLFEDNVEKVFGKGVRIKEISIERTRKPLSKKIGPYLPDNYHYIKSKDGWESLSLEDKQRIDQLITLIRKPRLI